jgi:hypothetical protein
VPLPELAEAPGPFFIRFWQAYGLAFSQRTLFERQLGQMRSMLAL